MSSPRIDSARKTLPVEVATEPAEHKPTRGLKHHDTSHSSENTVSKHPGHRPFDPKPSAFVAATDAVSSAPHVAEATKLANELAPKIAGHHTIEYRYMKLLPDENGHVHRVEERGTVEIDLPLPSVPLRVEPSASRSYGVTPALSTDSFELSLAQANERGVVDTARTMVHEWGHTAVNRNLMERMDPIRAYEVASRPIGLWESLSYKSPSTGEFVQVTPSGQGVSPHEMVGQYAGALFDKALAERKASKP